MRLSFLQYKEEIMHKMRIWEIKENKDFFVEMEKSFGKRKPEKINISSILLI